MKKNIFIFSLIFLLTSCGFFPAINFKSGVTIEGKSLAYDFKEEEFDNCKIHAQEALEEAEKEEDYNSFEYKYLLLVNDFNRIKTAYSSDYIKFMMYGDKSYLDLCNSYQTMMTELGKTLDDIRHVVFNNSFKSLFYEGLTDEYIINIIGPTYSNEYYTLLNEQNNIVSQYLLLDSSSRTYDDDVDELYVNYVNVSNELAAEAGYQNYMDYAYERIYLRPYDSIDTTDFFTIIKEDVYPYLLSLQDKIDLELKELRQHPLQFEYFRDFIVGNGFTNGAFNLFEDYANSFNASKNYLDIFNSCWYQNRDYFISYESNANEAAFTDDFLHAMLFANRYEIMTIVHEFGHYYHGMNQGDVILCYDLAETHSQGNEMLFNYYIKNNLNNNVQNIIYDYQYYSTLSTIVNCALVNELEKRVYLDEDYQSCDADYYCEQIKNELDYSKINFNLKSYWRRVAIDSSCYYISYAVSGIGALNLDYIARIDGLDKAELSYEKLINYDDEKIFNFIDIYRDAGLFSPFDSASIKKIFNNI